jgi:hypothetical protein
MNIHRSCTERSLFPKITRKYYSYRVNQTSDCNGARLRSISCLITEGNISQTVEQPCVREREQMLLWADQKVPWKYKFYSNIDRIFISTYKSYWNGKEWGAQGYWNWYRTYWRSCVIICALYLICWIVWLATLRYHHLDVRGSVHHSIIHIESPTRCNSVSKFYFIFIWSSACFGRHTGHHQEPKTALAAFGFPYVEGCWTCSCWMLSASSNYTANNPPRMQNLRLIVQFWAPDDGRCVARNMLNFI